VPDILPGKKVWGKADNNEISDERRSKVLTIVQRIQIRLQIILLNGTYRWGSYAAGAKKFEKKQVNKILKLQTAQFPPPPTGSQWLVLALWIKDKGGKIKAQHQDSSVLKPAGFYFNLFHKNNNKV